jgi:hypothetical protein
MNRPEFTLFSAFVATKPDSSANQTISHPNRDPNVPRLNADVNEVIGSLRF